MTYTRVCSLDELSPGKPLAADPGGERLLVVKDGDTVLAASRVCLHRGASLVGGPLEGSVISCPLHYWKFDLKDGACVQVPQMKLKTYPVKIENNEVFVDV